MKQYKMLCNRVPLLIVEVPDDGSECVIYIPSKRAAVNRTWARELAKQLMDFADGKFCENTPVLPSWDGPDLKL